MRAARWAAFSSANATARDDITKTDGPQWLQYEFTPVKCATGQEKASKGSVNERICVWSFQVPAKNKNT